MRLYHHKPIWLGLMPDRSCGAGGSALAAGREACDGV
jgi:hypothetical protein